MESPERRHLDLRYRSLFDQHPDAVYELDLDGGFVIGNAALEELIGYSLTELRELSYVPFTHPDDVAHVSTEFARAARGEARRYEARGIHRDGHEFHLHITNLPIVIDGEVEGVYGIARDITNERVATRSLAETEARFRSTFEVSGAGIVVLSLDSRLLQVNPAFCAMVGYSEPDLQGSELWPLVYDEDRATLEEAVAHAMDGEGPGIVSEIRFHTAGDQVAWGRTSLTVVPSPEDEPLYLVAHVEDITARQATERRARHGEALLRIAGRIARLGGWAIDAQTREQYWSPEIHEILGFAPDVTPTVEEGITLFPEPGRQRMSDALEACLRDGIPFDLELEVDTVAGEHLTVRTVGLAERDEDGSITAARGAFQDITEQRRVTDETQRLQQRLAQAFEAMSDGVILLDDDWTMTYLNTSAAGVIGRASTELIGSGLLEVFPELTGTEALAAYHRSMDQRVATTVEPFWFEPLHAWLEVRVFPSTPGIALYFRDVTGRMEREQRLEEIALAEQNAADQLRQLDRVKNTFLTAVSHELRTPLTVVQGMAQTLPRLRQDMDIVVRDRIEDALRKHADRLAVLLDELLDLDRLSRGELQTQRYPIDVAVILRAVVARTELDRIHLDAPDHLEVEVDAVQFERIVTNLLDNATKYAATGAINVHLEVTREQRLRLEVVDGGPGIPPDHLEQVFEPFHRASDLDAQPGTGIGLSLVAEFARLHGGWAWAEPNDAGAHLIVELPLVSA